MKALVYEGIKKISYKDVEKPIISQNEVLIKVKYAAVCATDLRIFKGEKIVPFPRILGHEFSGIIVEIGDNVKEWEIGDRVTVYPTIACGTCYSCKENRKNICVNRKTIGYEYDGGFSQFVRIPLEAIQAGNLIKIPEKVSLIEAAISEPIAAAYNGLLRANIKEGEKVLIIGGGPIGLFHIQLVKIQKPALIIVSEPIEEKRKLAKELGADIAINPLEDNLSEIIMANTGDEGVDKVFLDVSLPKIIENTLDTVKKGGSYIIFAGSPKGSKISIDPNIIHYKEINITGASSSTPENHKLVLNLIADKKINLSPFLNNVFKLNEWEKAFSGKENYKIFKPIIKMDE